jgi:CBS domain-containing protein
MRIRDVLRGKGDRVVTVSPDTGVDELLGLLARRRIGAAVVSTDGTTVEGIVSERDVVRAFAERGASVLGERVGEICTHEVHTATPQTSVEQLMRDMTDGRFRHVPVLVDGRLAGIVSIGDIVKHRIDELETERSALEGYISTAR